jgi:hypothetical protein
MHNWQAGLARRQREMVTRLLYGDQLAGPGVGVQLHRPATPTGNLQNRDPIGTGVVRVAAQRVLPVPA